MKFFLIITLTFAFSWSAFSNLEYESSYNIDNTIPNQQVDLDTLESKNIPFEEPEFTKDNDTIIAEDVHEKEKVHAKKGKGVILGSKVEYSQEILLGLNFPIKKYFYMDKLTLSMKIFI